MPATITTYGCGDGKFGIPADESGMVIESLTFDYSNSSKEVKDRTGSVCGITMYDEVCKVSLNGKLNGGPYSESLAGSLLITNSQPLSAAIASGGLTLIEGLTVDYGNEEYQTIKVSATRYPNISL